MIVLRTLILAFSVLAAGAPAAHALSFALEYEASIQNVVTLGRMSLTGTSTDRAYQIAASMQTSGLASLFDDTRISARTSGFVSGQSLGWSTYNLSHAFARKSRRVAMRRSGGLVTADIAPRFSDMGTPPATEPDKQASFDPLTAVLALSRSVGRAGACSARVRVFDGRQHYALTLAPKAKGNYRGGGYNGAAVVCRMRYEPLSGFNMTPAQRARIPQGEIWFAHPSVGGFAAPLRIAVPTPAGEGRVDIKAYKVT